MWRRPSDGCFQIGIRRSIPAEGVSRYIRSTQCTWIKMHFLAINHIFSVLNGTLPVFHRISICGQENKT